MAENNFFGVKKGLRFKPSTLPVSGNLGEITYDSATNSFKQWSGTSWVTIAGSGSGVKNFITGGDAESGTTGWVTYADAAATRPVDGTGGSPNVTFTTSGTSPLISNNSFLFTKDAANRQGQGASFDFTIDAAYKAKVLQINIDYIVSSGTFVAGTNTTDSDLIVYLYDVTNSTLIEPSSIKFLSNSSTLSDKFSSTFQTSATGTQYRLILHCASTSASAYVLKLDDITVSPSVHVYGTPITDWQFYTMSIVDSTSANVKSASPITNQYRWRRVGQNVEIEFAYYHTSTLGSAGTGAYRFGLPTGLTTDGNVIGGAGNSASSHGIADADIGGASRIRFAVSPAANGNYFALSVGIPDGSTAYTTSVGATNGGSGTSYAFNQANVAIAGVASIPINGWSSSVQMSDQTDTRVVALRARRTAAATSLTTGVQTNTPYDIVDRDSHGSYNSSTGVYTFPVSGWYEIKAKLCHGTGSATGFRAIVLEKNGTTNFAQSRPETNGAGVSVQPFIADTSFFNAGETFKVYALQNSGGTLALSSDGNATVEQVLNVERVTGPSAIAANELIASKYYNNAGTSIPNNTVTIIDFGTKDFDTHGTVTTGASWKFTAPASGKYKISAVVLLNANTGWATTEALELELYKNNVINSLLSYTNCNNSGGANVNISSQGSTTINLIAGDFIDVRLTQASGGAITLAASGYNHISIERIGF